MLDIWLRDIYMAELHSNLFTCLCRMENPSVTIMNKFVSIHNFVFKKKGGS